MGVYDAECRIQSLISTFCIEKMLQKNPTKQQPKNWFNLKEKESGSTDTKGAPSPKTSLLPPRWCVEVAVAVAL